MRDPIRKRPAVVRAVALIGAGTLRLNTRRAGLTRRGWIGLCDRLVFVSALLGLPAATFAAGHTDVGSPEYFQCVGKNRFSGAAVVSAETYGDPTGRAYAATLFNPVLGTPLIVYGPRYRQTAPLLRAFIKRHECQHASGVRDEIAANCAALVQMRALGLTADQDGQIGRWHKGCG